VAEDESGAVTALAALRDELVKHPELGPYQDVIRDLTRRLAASAGQQNRGAKAADGWADLDLIATLGVGAPQPAAMASPLPAQQPSAGLLEQRWWRAAIDALPPVLVFVPILLTWLSLFAASNAYRSLEASASARTANAGKSFLELWQQGFAGRLPATLSFGYVAMYTVVAVTLLIVMTAFGGHFRRRDEKQAERDEKQAETAQQTAERARVAAQAAAEQTRIALLPTLVRAQAELNKYRLGTPVRFASELSKAAIALRELLTDTSEAQDSALKLAHQNQSLSEKLGDHAIEMQQITGELQSAAGLMRAAADALADANSVLATEVTGRVEASVGRLDQVTGQAAARVGDLVQVGQESLDGITDRFDTAMAGIKVQIAATTTAMIDAGEKYAAAIGDSSGNAAAKIGEVYRAAVGDAAVILVNEMARTTGELSAILRVVDQSANTQLAAAVRTEEAVTAHAEAVTTAAERISGAADNMSGVAETISGVAAGVSGSSAVLERAVADYTSVQQQVADTLSHAADDLSAHATSLAERLAAVNATQTHDTAYAADPSANTDLEVSHADGHLVRGEAPDLVFPDSAAPDKWADLTGTEESP
jgi:hypothetical protein